MATAGSWGSLESVRVDEVLIEALNRLGYPTMTPVQAAAVPPLLTSRDVAVDAETGSGKTLSFLVPVAQMLIFSRNTRCLKASTAMRALVIVPTRELAAQVHAVAEKLFELLPGGIVPVPLIGGCSGEQGAGPDSRYANDTRLVIATPGRLDAALLEGTLFCKSLEVLILDEADRLLDMGFAVSLTSILSKLPKQRRTGLYSATQTDAVEALSRAGLRNPVRVAVRTSFKESEKNLTCGAGSLVQNSDVVQRNQHCAQVIPRSLVCHHVVIDHEHKLHHLMRLLVAFPDQKFIIYFLTCACVDYFNRLPHDSFLQQIEHTSLSNGNQQEKNKDCKRRSRYFVALHGKMTQPKRTKALREFSNSLNGVLACTDVAARGLDIPDVDWVVQFDPPQDPDAYVHRVGRTARLGKRGRAVIYLAPSEDAYIDFLAVRDCPTSQFDWDSVSETLKRGDGVSLDVGHCCVQAESQEQSRSIPCGDEMLCQRISRTVRGSILNDRAILDSAEKAFLSYIRAYKEHRCGYLLPFSRLQVGSVARAFSLLRLPRFHEFKKFRAKLDLDFDKSIAVRDIAYKDKHREKRRQADIRLALSSRAERRAALRQKSKKQKKRKAPAARHHMTILSEKSDDVKALEEMDEEARMIKKLKRGKISRNEFDAKTGYSTALKSSEDNASCD